MSLARIGRDLHACLRGFPGAVVELTPGGVVTDSNGRLEQLLAQDLVGRSFADITELRKMLAENPQQLARGVTRHLVTYGTGAPVTPIDQPAISNIVGRTHRDDNGVRSLIHSLVQSDRCGRVRDGRRNPSTP